MSEASTWPDSRRKTRSSRSRSVGPHDQPGSSMTGRTSMRDELAARAGDLGRQLEGAVEIGHVDDVVAAERLLGLGERPVGGEALPVLHLDGRRGLGALQRVAGDELLAVDDASG